MVNKLPFPVDVLKPSLPACVQGGRLISVCFRSSGRFECLCSALGSGFEASMPPRLQPSANICRQRASSTPLALRGVRLGGAVGCQHRAWRGQTPLLAASPCMQRVLCNKPPIAIKGLAASVLSGSRHGGVAGNVSPARWHSVRWGEDHSRECLS